MAIRLRRDLAVELREFAHSNENRSAKTAIAPGITWKLRFSLSAMAGASCARAQGDREIAQAIADGYRPNGMAQDEEVVYHVLNEVLQNKTLSDVTTGAG